MQTRHIVRLHQRKTVLALARPLCQPPCQPPWRPRPVASMTPRKDSIPHETRTAAEPRQNKLYPVRLAHIEQINPTIRLLRLALPAESLSDDETDDLPQEPFSFLPGQWLDVHVPGIQQAGGFTITSTPSDAHRLPAPDASAVQDSPSRSKLTAQHTEIDAAAESDGRYPYVELAVQNSPSNPPAAWLWKPTREILGREVNVRVGGSFVWPPATIPEAQIQKVVFVAGGVGINPLISILSHITELASPARCSPEQQEHPHTHPHIPSIHFLYTTRIPHTEKLLLDGKLSAPQANITREALDEILFLSRLRRIVHRVSSCRTSGVQISLDVFLTNIPPPPAGQDEAVPSVLAQATQSLNEDGADRNNNKNNIHVHSRRISRQDLGSAMAGAKDSTVCYVCGPPPMTDEFVGHLGSLIGADRVLYEKWW
ncbi:hypothetical protein PISL3812_09374 [Talaromyces islandicus]|uniref:FAD-binding FR-type domain-containing protein n=1 Tax=Talaromyces islandicus TaxID=28573 RepID=A0A0U1M9N4_TALIS|nr:hypothetical protein PISL3812_09374 [Talaromyces islandicus]